jgi:hypothetical protein
MSEQGRFFTEGQLDVSTVVPAYQEAFRGWPWYEVSKCVDPSVRQRCEGSLSKIAIGQTCQTCDLQPTQPAYETEELIERFTQLEATRPTRWYIESVNKDPALAALAWTATPEQIAQEKYSDVPAMQEWLTETLPDQPIVWLDEVFADKRIRTTNNLANFESMCRGFMRALDTADLAYRTISPAMLRAAEKNFDVLPTTDVPDRRSFIRINGDQR